MEVMTKAEVIEAVREFGEALANCEECRAVKEAQQTLWKDSKARELLSDYQSTLRAIQMTQMWGGGVTKDKLDELNKLQTEINSNQIIRNLLDAQRKLQEMMGNLNTEISGLLGIDFASNSSSGCC